MMNYDTYNDGRGRPDFIGELGDAMRQNPVPAALVGAGILWLFMGGRDVVLGGASRTLLEGLRSPDEAAAAAVRASNAGRRLRQCQSDGGKCRPMSSRIWDGSGPPEP